MADGSSVPWLARLRLLKEDKKKRCWVVREGRCGPEIVAMTASKRTERDHIAGLKRRPVEAADGGGGARDRRVGGLIGKNERPKI